MIVFDICDTMYDSNTTFDFMDYMFLKNTKYKIMRKISRNLFFKVINKIVFKIFKIDLTRVIFLKYLSGFTRIELEKEVNDFYKEYLVSKKRSNIISLLKKLKKENKNILLMSATIDIVAKRIATEFDVKFISSKLAFSKEICLGELEYDLLGQKDNYIKEEIELVVTDNLSDISLVKIAKKSIILSKKKNIGFWNNQKLENYQIVEI